MRLLWGGQAAPKRGHLYRLRRRPSERLKNGDACRCTPVKSEDIWRIETKVPFPVNPSPHSCHRRSVLKQLGG